MNTDYTPVGQNYWDENDRLFVIGNGHYPTYSDALVMLKNGNTTLNGVLTLKLQSSAPFTCTSAKYGSIAVNSVGVPCVCALNGTAGWYSLFNGSACSW